MKRTKMAALALATAVLSSPSSAEDWSGNWIGVTLGYGAGSYGLGVSALNETGPAVDVESAVIGLRYARNFQVNGRVLGFDAEASTGPDGVAPIETEGTDWACLTGDCNVSIKHLVTMRGRFGLLVDARTLAYAAAGLAVGRVEGGIFESEQQGASTAVGYTIGVGIERMLSQNLSLLGEAEFTDLGTLGFGTNGASEAFDGTGDFLTVQLAVNFRF